MPKSYFSKGGKEVCQAQRKVACRVRDRRAISACAECSNEMSNSDGKNDGKRANDAIREGGEIPALASSSDLHSFPQGAEQQMEVQKLQR